MIGQPISTIARELALAYYTGKRHAFECITGEQAAPTDEIIVEDMAEFMLPLARQIYQTLQHDLYNPKDDDLAFDLAAPSTSQRHHQGVA